MSRYFSSAPASAAVASTRRGAVNGFPGRPVGSEACSQPAYDVFGGSGAASGALPPQPKRPSVPPLYLSFLGASRPSRHVTTEPRTEAASAGSVPVSQSAFATPAPSAHGTLHGGAGHAHESLPGSDPGYSGSASSYGAAHTASSQDGSLAEMARTRKELAEQRALLESLGAEIKALVGKADIPAVVTAQNEHGQALSSVAQAQASQNEVLSSLVNAQAAQSQVLASLVAKIDAISAAVLPMTAAHARPRDDTLASALLETAQSLRTSAGIQRDACASLLREMERITATHPRSPHSSAPSTTAVPTAPPVHEPSEPGTTRPAGNVDDVRAVVRRSGRRKKATVITGEPEAPADPVGDPAVLTGGDFDALMTEKIEAPPAPAIRTRARSGMRATSTYGAVTKAKKDLKRRIAVGRRIAGDGALATEIDSRLSEIQHTIAIAKRNAQLAKSAPVP